MSVGIFFLSLHRDNNTKTFRKRWMRHQDK
nr:MAG TPA: hypothetical protein [Caudoviricetes sp.]DAX48622.1 MAG TPA: hypothetical protein [Caudoviricetes sp.]